MPTHYHLEQLTYPPARPINTQRHPKLNIVSVKSDYLARKTERHSLVNGSDQSPSINHPASMMYCLYVLICLVQLYECKAKRFVRQKFLVQVLNSFSQLEPHTFVFFFSLINGYRNTPHTQQYAKEKEEANYQE